jgi:monoamine oxidase
MAEPQEQGKARKEQCVVIVGAGFSGFNAARELAAS